MIFLRRNTKLQYVIDLNLTNFDLIRLGPTAILRFNKPCNRCPVITIDPEKGEKDIEENTLKTLRTFRLIDPNESPEAEKRRKAIGQSPLFSVQFALDIEGIVQIGDQVFVEKC